MKGQILGVVRGRRASLEVNGDTLIWRADDNVATTIHEVKQATLVQRRLDPFGGALAIVGGLTAFDLLPVGLVLLTLAAALLVRRLVLPIPWLVVAVGDRKLVLRLDKGSADLAAALVQRIDHALTTGEVPSGPPALP